MTEPLQRPEPGPEPPHDPHTPPLEDDDDARYLRENDPRRIEAEARRGRRFADEERG
jgi:hypothetical protein